MKYPYSIFFKFCDVFCILHIYNYNNEKRFKNEQRSRDAAAKIELIQVEYIGKINNYCEDIPPYNNTH